MVTPPMAQATTGSNVIFMCEILFEGGVRGPYQIAWYNATGGELFINFNCKLDACSTFSVRLALSYCCNRYHAR